MSDRLGWKYTAHFMINNDWVGYTLCQGFLLPIQKCAKGGLVLRVPTNGSWGHRFWVSPGRPRQMSFEKFIFSPLCSFGVEMCHGALTHPKTQTPQGVGGKCPCHPEGCTFPLKKQPQCVNVKIAECISPHQAFPPKTTPSDWIAQNSPSRSNKASPQTATRLGSA